MLRRLLPLVRPLACTAAALVALSTAWPIAMSIVAERIGAGVDRGVIPPSSAARALQSLDAAATPEMVRLAMALDPVVAEPAQRALAARVDTWRRAAARSPRNDLANRVDPLLETLALQAPITESGRRWADRLLNELVADASLAPPEQRLSLMTAIERTWTRVAQTPIAPQPAGLVVLMPRRSIPPAGQLVARTPRRFVPPPTVSTPRPPAPPAIQSAPAREPDRPPAAESAPLFAQPSPPLKPVPVEPAREPRRLMIGAASDRELLAALLERGGARPAASGPASARRDAEDLDPELREIHDALYRRGYRGVSLRHVRDLLSDDPRDRVALVKRLLIDATGDTAKLLLLLAYDDDAEVRAAALTGLAASPRRELVEASWKIAIRDEDPRVGRLAESIGERLR